MCLETGAGREVRAPLLRMGRVLPRGQAMVIGPHLAPRSRACLGPQLPGLLRPLLRARPAALPPCSHLPQRLQERPLALPLYLGLPCSLEVGGEVTEAEICSLTSCLRQWRPVSTGFGSSSWKNTTGSPSPTALPAAALKRGFSPFGTLVGQSCWWLRAPHLDHGRIWKSRSAQIDSGSACLTWGAGQLAPAPAPLAATWPPEWLPVTRALGEETEGLL